MYQVEAHHSFVIPILQGFQVALQYKVNLKEGCYIADVSLQVCTKFLQTGSMEVDAKQNEQVAAEIFENLGFETSHVKMT